MEWFLLQKSVIQKKNIKAAASVILQEKSFHGIHFHLSPFTLVRDGRGIRLYTFWHKLE
jgi:hypothetical protein